MADITGTADRVAGGLQTAQGAITTIESALVAFGPQIQVADMLIHLGIATVEKIRGYFASKLSDDEILNGIMTEVDARIARRS
jgi:hypothetical protein